MAYIGHGQDIFLWMSCASNPGLPRYDNGTSGYKYGQGKHIGHLMSEATGFQDRISRCRSKSLNGDSDTLRVETAVASI